MTEAEQIKQLKDALEWYAERASKITTHVLRMDKPAILRVVRELAVDNGKIAFEAQLPRRNIL